MYVMLSCKAFVSFWVITGLYFYFWMVFPGIIEVNTVLYIKYPTLHNLWDVMPVITAYLCSMLFLIGIITLGVPEEKDIHEVEEHKGK